MAAPDRISSPPANENLIRDRGPWIQTFSGWRFFVLNPEPQDVFLMDLAHALSLICRFTGHTRRFYSVAQHSVLASFHVPPVYALEALLHDASEAYLCDVSRPVKPYLHNYREIESNLMRVIAERFKFFLPIHAEVDAVDVRLLMTERRDLLLGSTHRWDEVLEKVQPFPWEIVPWSPEYAEERFLQQAHELGV